jgi:hypothetical protein
MLVNFLLYALAQLAAAWAYILPVWDLPAGLTAGLGSFGSFISLVDNILPDGTLANLLAASVVLLSITTFALPFLVARGFKIPFVNK